MSKNIENNTIKVFQRKTKAYVLKAGRGGNLKKKKQEASVTRFVKVNRAEMC